MRNSITRIFGVGDAIDQITQTNNLISGVSQMAASALKDVVTGNTDNTLANAGATFGQLAQNAIPVVTNLLGEAVGIPATAGNQVARPITTAGAGAMNSQNMLYLGIGAVALILLMRK